MPLKWDNQKEDPRSVPKLPPSGYQQSGNQDGGLVLPMNWRSPPFFGNWPDQTMGAGKKKAPKKKQLSKKGNGLLLGKNSPFKNVPLLNILL